MYLPSIPRKRPHVLHRKDAFPQIPRELCPSRLGLSTLRRSTAACVAVAKLISSMVDGENDPGQYLGQLESAMMTFLLMAGCPNVQHCEFQGESPQWIDMNWQFRMCFFLRVHLPPLPFSQVFKKNWYVLVILVLLVRILQQDTFFMRWCEFIIHGSGDSTGDNVDVLLADALCFAQSFLVSETSLGDVAWLTCVDPI